MKKLVIAILLILINFGMFWQTTGFDLIWKDKKIVELHSRQDSSSLKQISQFWIAPQDSVYMPLSKTVFALLIPQNALQSVESQKNIAKKLHMTNLMLHSLSTIIVFLILNLIFQKAIASGIGALLFAIHPLQVETIVAASNLPFILGSCFALYALYQYLIYSKKLDSPSRFERKSFRNYYMATISYILAVFAFPTAILTPLVGFIIERFLPKDRFLLQSSKPTWPLIFWTLVGIPVAIVTISLQQTSAIETAVPILSRPLIAADAIFFYLFKFFAPLAIGPDYGRSPGFVFDQWWGYLTWIVPLTITIFLAYWRESARSWYAASFATFVIFLAPFLGLLPFEAQESSTVANRYVYLATFGGAFALSYGFSMAKQLTLPVVSLAVLGVFGYLSAQQLQVWKNDQILWQHSLAIHPHSPIAHKILADNYRLQGNNKKAKEHYSKVLIANQTNIDSHFFLGEIERQLGNFKTAREHYNSVLT